MRCGVCKAKGVNLEHVRAHKTGPKGSTPTGVPYPSWSAVPDGFYAFRIGVGDEILFTRVRRPKTGKWKGILFLDKLIGAPGNYHRSPIRGADKKKILDFLSTEKPRLEAAQLFGQEKKQCGRCGAMLTDETSRTIGLGPDCREMPGWTSWKVNDEQVSMEILGAEMEVAL